MTKRERIAAALLALGILICIGTVGDADFNGMWATEYYIRAGIGMALCLVAIPISGDVTRDDVESILPKISAGKKVGRKDGNHSN